MADRNGRRTTHRGTISLIAGLVVVPGICACHQAARSRSDVLGRLHEQAAAACGARSCRIDVASSVPWAWDRLYYFPRGASPRRVQEVVKQATPLGKQFSSKLLIVSKGAVVHAEEVGDLSDEEQPPGFVWFEPVDGTDPEYFCIDRSRSICEAVPKNYGDHVVYKLVCATVEC